MKNDFLWIFCGVNFFQSELLIAEQLQPLQQLQPFQQLFALCRSNPYLCTTKI